MGEHARSSNAIGKGVDGVDGERIYVVAGTVFFLAAETVTPDGKEKL
jgi:hypothetical protein